MKALHTDLYQLTMAAGYFAAGKIEERAVFELFVRRLPPNREYLITAGLQQAVDYLLNLRFTTEQIDYLRTLSQFGRATEDFWRYLLDLRFTGNLFAMPEGTAFYPAEPIVTVHAPIIEAQIVETYLVATLAHQSMIASKAARVVAAAQGRGVVEFGARRAHSPEAAVLGARAAYIGGCTGTSNVETGFRFGVPVFGTSAHSWVLAFECEVEAFRALQQLLGPGTVYLIDSYNTVEGAKKAASLGPPMWGVRLDSGDLVELSKHVRKILDAAGFGDAKIMASSDLNEERISALLDACAPIDVFGVGTELATSADAPSLAAVYKLVELESEEVKRYTAKYSPDKQTLPGAKQVFRYATHDVIGCSSECSPEPERGDSEALLRPVILDGRLIEPLPSAGEARERCAARTRGATGSRPVTYSRELLRRAEEHNRRFA